jgi:hypothetical protein
MDYSRDGYTASIQHVLGHKKDAWVYAVQHHESGEMLYEGCCNTVLEAVDAVEQRVEALRGSSRIPAMLKTLRTMAINAAGPSRRER